MLGEAALTRTDAERYMDAYFDAIDAIEGGDGTLAARAASRQVRAAMR